MASKKTLKRIGQLCALIIALATVIEATKSVHQSLQTAEPEQTPISQDSKEAQDVENLPSSTGAQAEISDIEIGSPEINSEGGDASVGDINIHNQSSVPTPISASPPAVVPRQTEIVYQPSTTTYTRPVLYAEPTSNQPVLVADSPLLEEARKQQTQSQVQSSQSSPTTGTTTIYNQSQENSPGGIQIQGSPGAQVRGGDVSVEHSTTNNAPACSGGIGNSCAPGATVENDLSGATIDNRSSTQ